MPAARHRRLLHELAMGPGAHPILIGSDVQNCVFALQLLQKCLLRGVLGRRTWDFFFTPAGTQMHTNVWRLDSRWRIEKISERDGIDNFIGSSRIFIYAFDALPQRRER